MYKHDLFVVAYEKLKSVPGNMTPGADGTTLDEFSTKTIENIVAQLRNESFRFSRARGVSTSRKPTEKLVRWVLPLHETKSYKRSCE
ncbi:MULTISPECIES: hypothetical protein [Burkholderia]|uniref:Uncharacterized protein n=1 Tax=Burkholderia pyrrocinia TaxID=60550 RepID=A0A318HRS9_BURPY|nr:MULTISPECIES: hypothetical protein [Burkholderia]PXX21235.1 hypothetical protein NA66_10564 [Burkholderia pyrrocinia]SFW90806.1 hypothetical protein SAMN03159384_07102 [Burkholderia sp. NFACC33-1]SFY46564.1 hypothetical protein SAMN03159408_07105 [Burkholderia sp. NFPP32]